MKYTTHYIKTKKQIDTEIESKNGQLLIRGSFIHQEMAGVYTFLPLGLKVLSKIENIVRKHMDTISSELKMTSLHPKSIWEKSGRLETIDVLMKTTPANEVSKNKSNNEYILGCTHEDMITPLVAESVQSYKDLPIYLYQIQTKFRNEARAKSGLMRGREFLMKDLYSFSRSIEELMQYYEIVKQKYIDIYKELGIGDETFVTLASGGDFTSNFSHEFQLLLDAGEDEIYLDRANKIAYNKEIVNDETAKKLGIDFSKMEIVNASEVGNIFPLETKFSKAFDLYYTDENGEKQIVWMGSYGIGISRLMGCIAEKFNDDKGLLWPENIAPFKYHICLLAKDKDEAQVANAMAFYNGHKDECLFDDRIGVMPGEKFADADLIGCPIKVIFSAKNPNGEFINRK